MHPSHSRLVTVMATAIGESHNEHRTSAIKNLLRSRGTDGEKARESQIHLTFKISKEISKAYECSNCTCELITHKHDYHIY